MTQPAPSATAPATPGRVVIQVRVEVMPERANTGEAYDARVTDIKRAVSTSLRSLGIDMKITDEELGLSVALFEQLTLTIIPDVGAPTGQEVPTLAVILGAAFVNTTRADVAAKMSTLRDNPPRGADGSPLVGVSWQFIDLEALAASLPTS